MDDFRVAADNKLFSILLICFGDYPQYSRRALASLSATPRLLESADVFVGCNACGPETIQAVRQGLSNGQITAVVESPRNLHKSPMLRTLLELVRTPYVLVMDDDSHVHGDWVPVLRRFLQGEEQVDVAGQVRFFRRQDKYQKLVEQRPWWRGEAFIPDEQRHWIKMCVGGLCLMRTEFLRRHDYPDRQMVIEFDDVMLADLVYQVGGRLAAMPDELLGHFVIGDGDRRWDSASAAAMKPPPTETVLPRQVSPAEALKISLGYFHKGRFDEAEIACQKVLQFEPKNPNALHLLGMIAHQTGRNALSIELVKRAISLKPEVPDFHNNLGNILAKLGRLEEAFECFKKAIALKADYAEAHNNLANLLARQGKMEEAIVGYRKATQIKPGYVEAYSNLGNTYRRLGQFERVLECFQEAVKIDPNSADAHASLATAYQEQGRMPEALATIDRAIARNGENPRLRFNKSLMLLSSGDWDKGWPEYEWRWRLTEHNADRLRFKQPLWEGEDLAGKTLLVHCEQGLGATFQFIRYVPLLAAKGIKLILECQPPLKSILGLLPVQVPLYAKGEALPAFDVHVPLLSLPRVLKTTPASIPVNVPYLHADAKLIEKWKAHLSADSSLKVGINWQGNPAYGGDPDRSIRLKHFASLGQVAGVKFYSLQKTRGTEQITELEGKLKLSEFGSDFDESAGRFMDTAAIMHGLDLVITSDTSIAHLAGAMGIPVWVALCFAPDWRWMIGSEDYRWYPSMRLFRQKKAGDWDEVFGRIATALAGQTGQKP